jgi:hypothetical protein
VTLDAGNKGNACRALLFNIEVGNHLTPIDGGYFDFTPHPLGRNFIVA